MLERPIAALLLLSPAAAMPAAAMPAAAMPAAHVVRPGDTLSVIAARYHVKVATYADLLT